MKSKKDQTILNKEAVKTLRKSIRMIESGKWEVTKLFITEQHQDSLEIGNFSDGVHDFELSLRYYDIEKIVT